MRERKGSIQRRDGHWWARVRYTDPETGLSRELRRKAASKAEAADLRDSLLQKLSSTSNRFTVHEHALFADFAKVYLETFAIDPQYAHGHRVAGLKSVDSVRSHVKTLVAFFEGRPLSSIRYADLAALKRTRLRTPIVMKPRKTGESPRERQRSIANVNRLLAVARRMFNVARREG